MHYELTIPEAFNSRLSPAQERARAPRRPLKRSPRFVAAYLRHVREGYLGPRGAR